MLTADILLSGPRGRRMLLAYAIDAERACGPSQATACSASALTGRLITSTSGKAPPECCSARAPKRPGGQ